MTFWTVTIVSVYLILILIIGFYSASGAGKDAESFFVAKRNLNWLQESMAVFTAIAPAGALMGTIGLFYRDGGNMFGYILGYSFLMPLSYWYIGSRLRRLGRARGYQTQAMFIRDFYQSNFLRWGVAIVGIFAAIPYFMVNPVALGQLLHLYTGFPYLAGVVLFVSVATVYTLKGGLRAVANTDIFHGVLLLIFFLVTLIVLVIHGGGIVHILDTPKARIASSGPAASLFLSWILYMGFCACVQPDRSFRMFSVRDDNNMRKGVIMSAAMTAFAGFSYYTIALAVRSFIPNITKTDTTLARGLEVAAVWLVPWFVMNAWGAGMSSFTCGMLSAANIFVKDLFEPWYVRRHNISVEKRDRLVIKTSRVFILCIALITVCVGFYPPIFIWTLTNLNNGTLIQFFPMFVLGFMWRGVTRLGVQVGWTCGILSMLMWSFVFNPPSLGPIAGIDALIVNFIVTVAVSLVVPEKKEVKEAREVLRRLASPEAEAERAALVAAPTFAD